MLHPENPLRASIPHMYVCIYIYVYVYICVYTYIYIYSSKSLDVVQCLYFGTKLLSSGTYK